MKNWLGIMIVVAAAGCQVEGPSSTENTKESTTEQAELGAGDFCSGIPYYCGAPLPQLLGWTGLPPSTPTTVALIDSKAVPGYLRIYGVDPVKGAVLWGRWALVQGQAGSVMQAVTTLGGGYLDYTRPPPCGVCPVGDLWVGEHMLETGRLKMGIQTISNDLTYSCYKP